MAWVYWKENRAYLYERIGGKTKCVKALGVITPGEAKTERITWMADHGKGDFAVLDMSMEVVWEKYMEYLVVEEYSPKTIKCAEECVYPFVRTMSKLSELIKDRIKAWDVVLQGWTFKRKGVPVRLSKETRAHRLRAISAFCRWATDVQGYFEESPFKVAIPEQRKDAGRALQGNEALSVLENWPNKPNRRTTPELLALSKLFFQIVFFGGTRVEELLGKSDESPGGTFGNLDRDNLILKLAKTKAGESREIALPKPIMDLIPQGVGPMFYGKISYTCLSNHLKKACQAAGVTGRFRVHDGRVTCASEWSRKNGRPKAAMNQFGWKTEKMALHYDKVATKERVAMAQNITYT